MTLASQRAFLVVGAALLAPALCASRLPSGDAATAPATRPDGAQLFKTYCASCHGTSAKGDGPVASQLRRRPPDLTRLATRNRGVFDADWVMRVIDGRRPVKGHGGADMPVWGDAFQGSDKAADAGAAQARIDAIVAHLRSIQIK